jgi:hypothetical protein
MYSYSHNETQESAAEFLTRTSEATEISEDKFISLTTKAAYNTLVKAIGRKANSFYQCSSCIYADIQNIHYIFNMKQGK